MIHAAAATVAPEFLRHSGHDYLTMTKDNSTSAELVNATSELERLKDETERLRVQQTACLHCN